jgi:hypothetical protein
MADDCLYIIVRFNKVNDSGPSGFTLQNHIRANLPVSVAATHGNNPFCTATATGYTTDLLFEIVPKKFDTIIIDIIIDTVINSRCANL